MGQHLFLDVFFGFYQELDCQHPTSNKLRRSLQKTKTIPGSWTEVCQAPRPKDPVLYPLKNSLSNIDPESNLEDYCSQGLSILSYGTVGQKLRLSPWSNGAGIGHCLLVMSWARLLACPRREKRTESVRYHLRNQWHITHLK